MRRDNRQKPFSNQGDYYPDDGSDPFGYGDRYYPKKVVDADLMCHVPPRSKRAYPYSYDPFTIWGEPGPNKECNASDYTDRLQEWDYKKYESLSKEIYWIGGEFQRPFSEYHCRGELIEKFLQRYHDNEGIKLLRVIEYCNVATGYTTYRLDYKVPSKGEAKPSQKEEAK